MLGIKTPEETTKHLAAVAEERHPEASIDLTEEDAVKLRLVGRIRQDWDRAVSNKRTVEHNMLECLRERKGEYGPQELQMIESTGGSDIYIKTATAKIRAGIAHIESILLPEGGRAHGISATKNPTIPRWLEDKILKRILSNPNMVDDEGNPIPPMEQLDVLQAMAKREYTKFVETRAKNMDRKIMDQLQEGGWRKAMGDFIQDFCTLPAAFMKGPFFKMEPKLTYEFTPQGKFEPRTEFKPTMKFRSINPFDAYPAPGVDNVEDGNFIERVRMSKGELYRMRGMPGWSDPAIREVIKDHGNHRLENWLWTDAARASIADHHMYWYKSTTELDGLHWYGKALGMELLEWGMDPRLIPDPHDEYEVDALLIGRHIVRAALNPDPKYRRPIHSACYEKIPGTLFGNSPSMLMRHVTRMVNATARAMANNLAHASGFQMEVDYTRISAETDIFDIHPFKVWQARESTEAGDRPAVRFFQPASNSAEYMNIMEYFREMADNHTGIPEFLHGGTGSNQGADATAKGRQLLLDQSSKLLRSSIGNIDQGIMVPILEMMYDWNMLNDPDENIKGDAQVVAKGANYMLQKDSTRQAHMAVMELTGADPEDRQIVGTKGRAYMLRHLIGTFEDIEVDNVIPDGEELDARVDEIVNAPPPPDPAQIKMEGQMQIESQKMDLERERMTLNQQIEAENQRGERMMRLMEMRSKEKISESQLRQGLMDETVKLRAARMSEREKAQIDVLKERMKAENQARIKVKEMSLQKEIAQMNAAPGEMTSDEKAITGDEVRSIVESVLAPMFSTFQNDTLQLMDSITEKLTQESDSTPQVINVNVDSSCSPVSKAIKTSRDAQGNLQATVTPSSS